MSNKVVQCGCDSHDIDPSDTDIVILAGKKWLAVCALRDSIRQLGLAKEELENIRAEVEELRKSHANYTSLVSQIEKFTCPQCFKPVKGCWTLLDGAVFCSGCAQELALANPYSDMPIPD